MADEEDLSPLEQKHRDLAAQAVDLFLPDDEGLTPKQVEDLEAENEPKLLALFRALDPVDAAAVAVNVCYELDPEEIAEFLAVLEGTGE